MRISGPILARSLSSRFACAALAFGATGCLEPYYVAPPGRVVMVERPAPVAATTTADDDDDDNDEESAPASVDVFYERLEPYGEWVDVAPYGRVWRPSSVDEDFVPYGSGGRWVNTDAGWSFKSNYEWGWAAFHYGRWFHDDSRGWVWMPDTVWGPAWVDWRYGDDYVGWVPLGPPGVVVVERNWVFVESRHFARPHIMSHFVPSERAHIAFSASVRTSDEVVHGGVRWRPGPPVDHVIRVTGKPVHTVHVNAPASGTMRVRTLARPTVSSSSSRSRSPAPARSPSPSPVRQPARPGHR